MHYLRRIAAIAFVSICIFAARPVFGYDDEREMKLRNEGWLSRDEVRLPPTTRPVLSDVVDPLTALELPQQWAYVPGKSTSRPSSNPSKELSGGAAPIKGRPDARTAAKPASQALVITTPNRNDNVSTRVITSSPEFRLVLVSEQIRYGNRDKEELFPPTKCEVYDLATAKQVGKLTLPPAVTPIAISQDGSRVLTQWTWRSLRLDVCDGRTGKHIVGWHPFQEEDNEAREVERPGVTWARFLDNDRVAIRYKETLTLWQLPQCKQIYMFDKVKQGGQPVFIGDGSMLLLQGNLFDLAGGRIIGCLAGCRNNSFVDEPAVSPDGARLAGSLRDNFGKTQLTVWDLTSGRMVSSQSEQPVIGQLYRTWCGANYLLCGTELKDINTGRCVWRYNVGQSDLGPVVFQERTWVMVQGALVGLELPDAASLKSIAQNMVKLPSPVIAPGTTVSLELRISGLSKDAQAYAKEVRDALERRLAEGKITVGENQPMTLQVKAELGRQIQLGRGTIDKEKSFFFQVVSFNLAWVDSKHEAVWSWSNESVPQAPQRIDTESVQAAGDEAWVAAKQYLGGSVVPLIVYAVDKSAAGQKATVLGEATITNAGEVKLSK